MKAILVLTFIAAFVGCSSLGNTPDNRTTNLGEKFVLKKDESAKIKNTNLRLKMLVAGQMQVEKGGDIPFCEFEVEFNDKTEQKNLSVGKSVTFGNLSVQLQSVNTTANPKAKDPWSETSCGFLVTKNTK